MNIYLINPPASKGIQMVREGRCMQRKGAWTTVWPPVTLATMAGMLLKEGHQVKLSDCIVENIDYARLKSEIGKFSPDIIVINTATASIFSDLYCARVAKEVSSKILTVAIGLHVTVLPDEAFDREEGLDYIIRGEPEFCFIDLVRAKAGDGNIQDILGLSFRRAGKINHNPNRGFDDDLNKLASPAWELINVKNYPLPLSGEPFLLVTTSKGCPHSCLFCPAKPYYGSRMRLRDPKKVVDEIAGIKERLKVRNFLIWSESFTEDRSYVLEFTRLLRERSLDISWVCNSRVDKVDPELLGEIKKAGCWMIGFGVESGSQEILDNSNKGITIPQIENAIRWAKEAALEVTAHVIFGLPGETRESGLKTINWLNKLDIDFAQFYCAVPWPSAPLYAVAKQNGWLTTGDWELYEQNHYIMDTGRISPKEVEDLRKKAMRSFYFSGRRILRVLSRINSPRKALVFLRMVRDFVSWI